MEDSWNELVRKSDTNRLLYFMNLVRYLASGRLGHMIVDACYLSGSGTHDSIAEEINERAQDACLLALITGIAVGTWGAFILTQLVAAVTP